MIVKRKCFPNVFQMFSKSLLTLPSGITNRQYGYIQTNGPEGQTERR